MIQTDNLLVFWYSRQYALVIAEISFFHRDLKLWGIRDRVQNILQRSFCKSEEA
jgi:hypothetical protein